MGSALLRSLPIQTSSRRAGSSELLVMSSPDNLKHVDHARLWSFKGMLSPLDGFFSAFRGSIHGLISFDHLKLGRA
jgi:hypothetical protein